MNYKSLEREIEEAKLVGELMGTLMGLSVLCGKNLTEHSLKKIADLKKRYDELFNSEIKR